MTKLLLPYAYDAVGSLVHIDDAQKGQKYICPNCGAELSLKNPKISKGQKHYRRKHFAHKNIPDNHCSESFLHKLFKDKCAEFIRDKISKQEDLFFWWECQKCNEKHNGNLLKKAAKVAVEYDLGECKPDIALLDNNGKIIIVIEVVVSHKPEPSALQYYEENKIACLQINVEDFSDCDMIENKLSNPVDVNLCPNPICEKCGKRKNSLKLVTVVADCPNNKCSKKMRIAFIVTPPPHYPISPKDFNAEEIAMARIFGAKIEQRYSKTRKDDYFANVCEHCNSFVGDHYMYRYVHLPYEQQRNLDYRCFHCEEEAERIEYEKIRKRNDILIKFITVR